MANIIRLRRLPSGALALATPSLETRMLIRRIARNLSNEPKPKPKPKRRILKLKPKKKYTIRLVPRKPTPSPLPERTSASRSPGLFVTPEPRSPSPVIKQEKDLFSASSLPSPFIIDEFHAPVAPMGAPAIDFDQFIRAPSWSPITPATKVNDNRVIKAPTVSPITPIGRHTNLAAPSPTPKFKFPPFIKFMDDDFLDDEPLDIGEPMIPVHVGDHGVTHIEQRCCGEKVIWTKEEHALEDKKWMEDLRNAERVSSEKKMERRREHDGERKNEEKERGAKRMNISGLRLPTTTIEKRKMREEERGDEEREDEKRGAKRMRTRRPFLWFEDLDDERRE